MLRTVAEPFNLKLQVRLLARQVCRVVAAWALIAIGGAICGGLICGVAERGHGDRMFWVREGTALGCGWALLLGIVFAIPVSYCCFPRWLRFAYAGTLGFGLPFALIGESGIGAAMLISPLGFILASMLAITTESKPQ